MLTNKQDRYRELMRASQQWEDIQTRMQYGCGHGKIPGDGDLYEFCPACPRIGINLRSGWRNEMDQ